MGSGLSSDWTDNTVPGEWFCMYAPSMKNSQNLGSESQTAPVATETPTWVISEGLFPKLWAVTGAARGTFYLKDRLEMQAHCKSLTTGQV